MQAADLVRAGDLAGALNALQGDVRAKPSDPKLRVFLFQLLCVRGEWDRAINQLDVAAQLDAANLLMAQVGRQAILCEGLRGEVFAGRRSPMIFGEPEEWIAWLVQANVLTAEGRHAAAAELRGRALEAAPASAGTVELAGSDGPVGPPRRFEWIADMDSRLGPVLEAIVEGRYYWIPWARLAEVVIEPPADLRDLVWVPANFRWTTGGTSVGLIPTVYHGTRDAGDPALALARKTDWTEPSPGLYLGRGQRVWATDEGEHPILTVRRIALDAPGA